jgi:hypothetical protein
MLKYLSGSSNVADSTKLRHQKRKRINLQNVLTLANICFQCIKGHGQYFKMHDAYSPNTPMDDVDMW